MPSGQIRHALKIVLSGRWYTYRKDDTPGIPLAGNKEADSHASPLTYQHTVEGLEMGALLALTPDFDVASLRTEPARIIAVTLQRYGAYTCDTASWDAYYFATEWSPAGRVLDEFRAAWGFDFVMPDLEHPWARDIATIIQALHVVDNNGPNNVGGGGTPLVPLAAPLTPSANRPPVGLSKRA